MIDGIDIGTGYPFGVTVRSIPTEKKEKVVALKNLQLFHNIKDAIAEYTKCTHERYGRITEVTLYVAGHKKAKDGVYEQDNDILATYKVVPPPKPQRPENDKQNSQNTNNKK